MKLLERLLVAVLLLLAAPILCGLYGALHDQVSYTVSPEYFTHFKFIQFARAIPMGAPARVGAAIVGFLASFWVGIPIGIVLVGAGFRYPDGRIMLRETFRAYLRVLAVGTVVSVLALGLSFLVFGKSPLIQPGWWVPEEVTNVPAFLRVGLLHEGSYLGGGIGFFWALIWQARRTTALRRASSRPLAASHQT